MFHHKVEQVNNLNSNSPELLKSKFPFMLLEKPNILVLIKQAQVVTFCAYNNPKHHMHT